MRLYPELHGPRARAATADIASIILLAIFVWAGVKVHGAVDRLAVLGEGVQVSGGAIGLRALRRVGRRSARRRGTQIQSNSCCMSGIAK